MTKKWWWVVPAVIMSTAGAFYGCGEDPKDDDDDGSGGSGGSAGSAGAGTGGAGGTDGGTGGKAGGGKAATPKMGIACDADKDCGDPPMRCILPSTNEPALGGGAPNGMCSASCVTDDECTSLEPNSLCLTDTNGENGACFLTCEFGVPALTYLDTPLDPDKCEGREDARCADVGSQGPYACLPYCGSDAECPGRFCSLKTGICVDSAPTGLPAQSSCDPANANNDECAGNCVGFTEKPGVGMCAQICPMGSDDIYADVACGGLSEGICVFAQQGVGVSDTGSCTIACNDHLVCALQLDMFCNSVGLPDPGFCLSKTAGNVVSPGFNKPCPNGNSDCTAPYECGTFPAGPWCVDPAYGLGEGPFTGPDAGADPDGGAD